MRVQLFVCKTGCVCYLCLGTNPFSDGDSHLQFTWCCVKMWNSSSEFREQMQNPTKPPIPLSRSTPVSMYLISVWINLTWGQFFFFSVTESPNHCLQFTFSSGPLGVSRFSWIGSHSLSTHHCPQATRLHSMLTCCGILPAAQIWVPFLQHSQVILAFCKCPRQRTLPYHLLMWRCVITSQFSSIGKTEISEGSFKHSQCWRL